MEPCGIRGRVVTNAPMKRYTSMRVGGPAPYLFYPEDAAGVAEAVGWLAKKKLPFRFLGKGTNVIVADRGIDMGVIRTTGMRRLRFRTMEGGAFCDAGGGLLLKRLIGAAAARGLSGLERLFGIPGTVGGAIKMNAGSFGAAVSDCLVSVVCVNEKGRTAAVQAGEITFGYRSSSIRDTECVVEATFRLASGDRAAIEADMDDVWRQRIEKHPMDLPSAGSIFKNKSGRPAWTYIDRAGLRGFTSGRACVSAKHPNFIVNLGGASASDVLAVIETVKKGVREATGVDLEEEVELWGFDGDRT
jgi:UDP-N-acetylmuramate dehydrogenase